MDNLNEALIHLPLKLLNKNIKKKKHPNPSSFYSLRFSFPFPNHPLPTTAPLPCSRILLYKPETDVCWGRAERPRCSGCQPHAFHSEMKAHSSPSCEAKYFKKRRKKGGKKQTLQMPSSLFKSSTYMSTPFCLLSTMYCSLPQLTASFPVLVLDESKASK